MAISFDNTTQMIEQSLDLRLKRASLLASNIANRDTPNFRPADLKFEGFLTESMDGTGSTADVGEVVKSTALADSLDGNTVDLDAEVAKFSDNNARYNTALELMRRKLALMSYAATSNG